MRLLLSILIAASMFMGAPDARAVSGGVVEAGQVDIGSGIIHQHTQRVVIHWDDFDIAPGERLEFCQPNVDAIALNRVASGVKTEIGGKLTANGRVVISNPDGISFVNGAKVDVHDIFATTATIATNDFMKSEFENTLAFSADSRAKAGEIVNSGQIIAERVAGLIAPNLVNEGSIEAKVVQMKHNDSFVLYLGENDIFGFNVNEGLKASLSNTGIVYAEGGKIVLGVDYSVGIIESMISIQGEVKAPVIDHNGTSIIIRAPIDRSFSSIIESSIAQDFNDIKISSGALEDTSIESHASDASSCVSRDAYAYTVDIDAIIDVSSVYSQGGIIEITGESINIGKNSVIRADGSGASGSDKNITGAAFIGDTLNVSAEEDFLVNKYRGAGSIKIGGDEGGQGEVGHASTLTIHEGALIKADALYTGDGGRVVLWSDGLSDIAGHVSVKGGAVSGGGGFVETSGKILKSECFSFDATAPNGRFGARARDPLTIDIIDGDAMSSLHPGPDYDDMSDYVHYVTVAALIEEAAFGTLIFNCDNLKLSFDSTLDIGSLDVVFKAADSIVASGTGSIVARQVGFETSGMLALENLHVTSRNMNIDAGLLQIGYADDLDTVSANIEVNLSGSLTMRLGGIVSSNDVIKITNTENGAFMLSFDGDVQGHTNVLDAGVVFDSLSSKFSSYTVKMSNDLNLIYDSIDVLNTPTFFDAPFSQFVIQMPLQSNDKININAKNVVAKIDAPILTPYDITIVVGDPIEQIDFGYLPYDNITTNSTSFASYDRGPNDTGDYLLLKVNSEPVYLDFVYDLDLYTGEDFPSFNVAKLQVSNYLPNDLIEEWSQHYNHDDVVMYLSSVYNRFVENYIDTELNTYTPVSESYNLTSVHGDNEVAIVLSRGVYIPDLILNLSIHHPSVSFVLHDSPLKLNYKDFELQAIYNFDDINILGLIEGDQCISVSFELSGDIFSPEKYDYTVAVTDASMVDVNGDAITNNKYDIESIFWPILLDPYSLEVAVEDLHVTYGDIDAQWTHFVELNPEVSSGNGHVIKTLKALYPTSVHDTGYLDVGSYEVSFTGANVEDANGDDVSYQYIIHEVDALKSLLDVHPISLSFDLLDRAYEYNSHPELLLFDSEKESIVSGALLPDHYLKGLIYATPIEAVGMIYEATVSGVSVIDENGLDVSKNYKALLSHEVFLEVLPITLDLKLMSDTMQYTLVKKLWDSLEVANYATLLEGDTIVGLEFNYSEYADKPVGMYEVSFDGGINVLNSRGRDVSYMYRVSDSSWVDVNGSAKMVALSIVPRDVLIDLTQLQLSPYSEIPSTWPEFYIRSSDKLVSDDILIDYSVEVAYSDPDVLAVGSYPIQITGLHFIAPDGLDVSHNYNTDLTLLQKIAERKNPTLFKVRNKNVSLNVFPMNNQVDMLKNMKLENVADTQERLLRGGAAQRVPWARKKMEKLNGDADLYESNEPRSYKGGKKNAQIEALFEDIVSKEMLGASVGIVQDLKELVYIFPKMTGSDLLESPKMQALKNKKPRSILPKKR